MSKQQVNLSLSPSHKRSSEFLCTLELGFVQATYIYNNNANPSNNTIAPSWLIFSYLYHVNKVVEILRIVDGQLVVLINHSVVDDLSRDTDAQDVVARMADGLSHQE